MQMDSLNFTMMLHCTLCIAPEPDTVLYIRLFAYLVYFMIYLFYTHLKTTHIFCFLKNWRVKGKLYYWTSEHLLQHFKLITLKPCTVSVLVLLVAFRDDHCGLFSTSEASPLPF